MPQPLDLVIAALLLIVYPLWTRLREWPAVRRRTASGEGDVRVALYRSTMLQQWAAMAAILATGAITHRPLSAFAVTLPRGAGLVVTVVAAVFAAVMLHQQWSSVARLSPKRLLAMRTRMVKLAELSPHTARELGWFRWVSITAGVCEEVIYRGYLPWALQPWLGMWGAAAVVLAGFTAAHAYQGRRQIPGVAMVGAFFTLLAIFSGSVVPCIVLHAAVDIAGGNVTNRIFGPPPAAPTPAAS